MHKFNRRRFFQNTFASAMGLSVRASVIGVPANFLLAGAVHAAPGDAKFTILSQSRQGESMNCNGPGSFSSDANSAAQLIEHPLASQLGANVLGSVGGVDYSGIDFETAVDINLGTQRVQASRPWQSVSQDFLNNLSCVWYRTGANAHPEMGAVRGLQGALLDDVNPNRGEELASAIALENQSALGCALNNPLLLEGNGYSKGNPLAVYKPTQLKSLFGVSTGQGIEPDYFSELYKQTIDEVYKGLKQNGSNKQRAFLDNHALTQIQARDLGDNLGDALENINGNEFSDQLRAAIAFIRLGVTPVVAIHHEFGGDNHSDSLLEREATETLESLEALNLYWQLINENNLADKVNLVTLDCFGRTPIRNDDGGRDHYGNMTLGLVHGSDIKPGMIGGVTTSNAGKPVANSIHSGNGGVMNPDIDADATLAAYGKTIMSVAGIDQQRLDLRVPAGRVITAI